MIKLVLTTAALILIGCSKPDDWTAFVYPDIETIPGPEKSESYIAGRFQSFEACQVAAIERVRTNMSKTSKQGAYVCGLNCAPKKDFGNLLVCEEKRK